MRDLISRAALYQELYNAGGCDAEKSSWAAGWDAAITEAARLLEQQPAAKLPPIEKLVYCHECAIHGRCAIEGIFDIAKLSKEKYFCGAGERMVKNE